MSQPRVGPLRNEPRVPEEAALGSAEEKVPNQEHFVTYWRDSVTYWRTQCEQSERRERVAWICFAIAAAWSLVVAAAWSLK